jgi:DNA-binding response OmpR family regulator
MLPETMPSPAQLAGITVLVVEDEYYVAVEVVRLLREYGAQVLGPLGDEAQVRELLGRTRPDCVLLDVNLGGDSTYPLARELIREGVAIVFTTGYGCDSLPIGLEHVPCLAKPIPDPELLGAVSRYGRRASTSASGTPQA